MTAARAWVIRAAGNKTFGPNISVAAKAQLYGNRPIAGADAGEVAIADSTSFGAAGYVLKYWQRQKPKVLHALYSV
jgi:hypothetical protein